MIHYELSKRYESAVVFAKPSEVKPMALQESLRIVESYIK
jgi:hypothetical protein